MVTKIIHVNFVIIFFFQWIINILLNDFLIEKLNFFLQKYTNLPCSSSQSIQVQHVCLLPMHYSKQIQ